MLKCLFCNDMIQKPDSMFWYWYDKFPLFCETGHYLSWSKNEDILSEEQWHFGLSGRISHVRIFDFVKREWNMVKLAQCRPYQQSLFAKQYVNQQSRKRQQLYQTRKAWLLCALRLKLCKDVRMLIARYLNKEPFNFWIKQKK